MAPLGPGVSSKQNSNPRPGFSPYESHNIQTINTNGEFLLDEGAQKGPLIGRQTSKLLKELAETFLPSPHC